MTRPAPRIFAVSVVMIFASLVAGGQSIDPRYPDGWHARQQQQDQEPEKWLPARIRQLEAESRQLLQQIEGLPQHEPKPLTSEFGYHSLKGISGNEDGDEFHYITADIVFNQDLAAIGLVPATDPFGSPTDTYAFPRRFKIEVLEGTGRIENGVWRRNPDGTVWTEVVNWMDEDFPDPGPYPVVFSDINMSASKVRVAVPERGGLKEEEFFALGELYLFRGQEGKAADNMSTFGSTGISFEATDSLAIPPAWSLQYLYDGVSVLGLPLSEMTTDALDFIARTDTRGPVQVVLDLGAVQRIGRIEIWPTIAPQNMAIPLFGFPGSVTAELSKDPGFSESRKIVIPDARIHMHNDNLLTLICDGEFHRYIRLTFDKLFEFMDHPILGIGEISVLEFGRVFSVGCDVTASGIPPEYSAHLPRLVDGYSRQRRILPESDWIIGLAKRRPLDARLLLVEQDLAMAREEWSGELVRLSVIGGMVLLLLTASIWGYQRRQRRQELQKLKIQITRDLHDEVGSSLGSISLVSEHLENMASDVLIKEELNEVSLMAREANASLLEVVWMTDQALVYLPDLVNKLVGRAEKVLRNVRVVADISPDYPDIKVNLTAKRHVISFFKEAIHNCARHARATRVNISMRVTGERFILSISDDGCGFDPDGQHDGWGLESMRKRAGELGSDLLLESAPGQGTKIRLEVPLDNLSVEPTHLYKTSN